MVSTIEVLAIIVRAETKSISIATSIMPGILGHYILLNDNISSIYLIIFL